MTAPFRTNLDAVPLVPGLRADEGWVDMRVQFLIDKHAAGSEGFLLGWTVLPPGARHDRHRHHQADEFFIVLQGSGFVYTNE
ncbi:MAG TPA: cupin domain-containing protein, partial [Acidimicrobiia bacterium]